MLFLQVEWSQQTEAFGEGMMWVYKYVTLCWTRAEKWSVEFDLPFSSPFWITTQLIDKYFLSRSQASAHINQGHFTIQIWGNVVFFTYDVTVPYNRKGTWIRDNFFLGPWTKRNSKFRLSVSHTEKMDVVNLLWIEDVRVFF